MSKNIVVFSDGTGQDGGARPEQRISNVYKMYRIARNHADTGIDPSRQVVFYDAGLGTDIGTTALTAPVRFVQKLLGSVTGAGIKRNIADCYEFIVNHYEPGDRIMLFGFSRGAYPWIEIECSRCRAKRDVDMAALRHPPTTFVHDLASRLRCSKCAKAGRRPPATLLQLAQRARHPDQET
ncbi:hypothetical protein BSZ21_17510 [Bradyrhizobium canariense]|uniref:T6SS phospholipase effector Tle1-like catalytic domain-containing protein n=1 Tax=Bradyrhizobium canariense TaxID=255045 RepID=UPI000A18D258|nr:DUF2235 domain-containing protein [Bradyrhizobium canariense]OSI67393.1 hypothetical protein BSZ21_17510 [Bradyrhizobium canariense]